MKFKKISMLLLAFTFALCVPFSSAYAGAGEWDYLGEYGVYYKTSTSEVYNTAVVYSGGGDFKVCAVNKTLKYYLMEDDATNADEVVVDSTGMGGVWISPGNCAVWEGIGKYVDGDNNKAEFYVQAYDPYTSIAWVKFYD